MGLLSLFKKNSSKDLTPYDRIGGEEKVRRLANAFYDIMATDPVVQELYQIHPQPLDSIRTVFFHYLSMWLGGPDLYTPNRGHPRLRARHMPFPIDEKLKEQWMYCMRKAMFETTSDKQLAHQLLSSLDRLAEHMINA